MKVALILNRYSMPFLKKTEGMTPKVWLKLKKIDE